MESNNTNEQVFKISSDTISIILEGISGIIGKPQASDNEKSHISQKINTALSEFLNDNTKNTYGDVTHENISQISNKENDQVTLNSNNIPFFEEEAKKINLSYSLTNVKDKDLTLITFAKNDIDKITSVCRNIAKKSIEKKKEPLSQKIKKIKLDMEKTSIKKDRNKQQNMER